MISPTCKVFFVLRYLPFIAEVTIRLYKREDAKSLYCFKPEHIFLDGGIKANKNIAGYLVWLDVFNKIFQLARKVNLRQIPCDMNVSFCRQRIKRSGLFLVHNTDVNAVEFYGQILPAEIFYRVTPFRICKEVIIQNFDPFCVWVPFHRFDWVNVSLLIMYQAERAAANAATRIELNRKRILRI